MSSSTLKVGDRIPSGLSLYENNPGNKVSVDEVLKGKRVAIFGGQQHNHSTRHARRRAGSHSAYNCCVALFCCSLHAVPGAFTPGCSKTHLPGFVADAEKVRSVMQRDGAT
jgi:2-Cys peroxiredoxin 5